MTMLFLLQYAQAVQKMEKDIIIFLLQEQADPNLKAKNGKTVLHHAVLSDVPEIAAALLEPRGNPEEISKVKIN